MERFTREWYIQAAADALLVGNPRIELNPDHAEVVAFPVQEETPETLAASPARRGRAGAYVQVWVWVDGAEYHDEEGSEERDRSRGYNL